jgi:hypothetical protein
LKDDCLAVIDDNHVVVPSNLQKYITQPRDFCVKFLFFFFLLGFFFGCFIFFYFFFFHSFFFLFFRCGNQFCKVNLRRCGKGHGWCKKCMEEETVRAYENGCVFPIIFFLIVLLY